MHALPAKRPTGSKAKIERCFRKPGDLPRKGEVPPFKRELAVPDTTKISMLALAVIVATLVLNLAIKGDRDRSEETGTAGSLAERDRL